MKTDTNNKFEEQLKLHAEKMQDIYKLCDSEEQTKISMINPFIELLEYDVRNPRVVSLEYPVSAKAGTRVDYALFCTVKGSETNTPTILIEAKAASNDLAHAQLFRQISDYANLQSSVEFVALTNGHLWKWFRKEKNNYGDRKLSQEAFLSHDILAPISRNSRELRFLKKLSSKSFTPDSAQQAADEVRFSEDILKFLEGIIDSPNEELRRLLFKQWGITRNKRDVQLFERVWPECVETFIESQARKMQIHELLQEVKVNQPGDSQTEGTDSGSGEQLDPSRCPSIGRRTFETDEGTISIDPQQSRKRAWKPSKSENWNIEQNSRAVNHAALNHISTLDSRGAKDFFEECSQKIRCIRHDSEFNIESKRQGWRECNEGYFVFLSYPDKDKKEHVKELSKLVHNSDDRDENGDLVHLWLPDMDSKE